MKLPPPIVHSLRKLTAILLGVVSLSSCATSHPRPMPLAQFVDLEKMYGGWYIVANIPNRMENSFVGLYDVYSPRKDGDIQEDFYAYKKTFAGKRKHYKIHDWVLPGSHNAEWRVQIFWPLRLPFLVLYTAPDYKYVLFGEKDRSLGWIFSRKSTIDDTDYHSLLEKFQSLGYDISKFKRVVQLPSQVGQPGFGGDAGERLK